MPKKKIEKKEVIASLQKHKTDVGSSEVQIGILTERVKYLSEHFAKNKKDKHKIDISIFFIKLNIHLFTMLEKHLYLPLPLAI